jgi:exonuclease III
MASRLKAMSITPTVVRNGMECEHSKLIVLHQNTHSLRNKITELEVLLGSELKHVDVICLTELWQSDQNLKRANIVDFKLLSAFCKSSSEHDGSGIYVKDGLIAREMSHFADISEEKNFEMSSIELPIYKLHIVCIYRSPDRQLEKFLNKLEIVIQKLLKKNKILLLYGEWNIDFLREDGDQKDLTELLLRYNLTNTIKSRIRITQWTNTLIDIIIINKGHYIKSATVIELGLSDHQAQVLPVLNKTRVSINERVLNRHFRENNIREFKYLLNKETWQEVLTETKVNAKFEVLMNLFTHSFTTALPLEYTHKKKPPRKGWMTQEIKISSKKKMRFLNMLNKQPNKITYKRVIREAKRRENDNYILHAVNKSKAVWQIIHKETWKTSSNKARY